MILTGLTPGECALIFVLSFAASLMVLSIFVFFGSRKPALAEEEEGGDAIFLFDQTLLVDASAAGRRLLSQLSERGGDGEWMRLMSWLDERIPGAAERLRVIDGGERVDLDLGGALLLEADRRADMLRIVITDGTATAITAPDRISLRAQHEELAALRTIVEHSPALVWRQAADGTVIWANAPYLDLARKRQETEDDLVWPLPRLFDALSVVTDSRRPANAPGRMKLAGQGDIPTRWFEMTSFPESTGELHFAVPVDQLVRAETTLREFLQTLGKTFAHLSVGLAIFDRNRKLQLFNPALSDLTTIGAEVLSARPSLFAFLDRLRENRMMPERKDYATWRQQMVELEQAAASGVYEETWNLATGQTYRVTGRPHPDGAVALLIEDISAEISLTRRFRAELELGQEVLDTLPQAVAVFAAGGSMVISNAAYGRLWGVDPGTMLCQPAVAETLRHWQSLTHPSPLWAEVSSHLATIDMRSTWDGRMRMKDGRSFECRLSPLSAGSTLVAFSLIDEPAPVLLFERAAN